MPWLDVVTTWGRLRAAPGFTVRDNAEENALSIQFNNAGEARVQLRSQHTKAFSASEEASFSVAMRAQVAPESVERKRPSPVFPVESEPVLTRASESPRVPAASTAIRDRARMVFPCSQCRCRSGRSDPGAAHTTRWGLRRRVRDAGSA